MKPLSIRILPHYCYLITNLINDKKYVGVTYKPIEDRFKEHLKQSKLSNTTRKKSLHYAIMKYGISNFKIQLIEKFNDYLKAYESEKKYIIKYNSKNYGYNETDGGDCGPISFKYKREDIIGILTKYCNNMSIIDISRECNLPYTLIYDLTRLRFSKLHNIPKTLLDKVANIKRKSKNRPKMTDGLIAKINKDFIEGIVMEKIAVKYNICANTVWNVLHKQSDKKIIDKLFLKSKKHICKDTVNNIIIDFISDLTVKQLSEKYLVSQSNIRSIIFRRTWKSLKEHGNL